MELARINKQCSELHYRSFDKNDKRIRHGIRNEIRETKCSCQIAIGTFFNSKYTLFQCNTIFKCYEVNFILFNIQKFCEEAQS